MPDVESALSTHNDFTRAEAGKEAEHPSLQRKESAWELDCKQPHCEQVCHEQRNDTVPTLPEP
eukprot:scaffold5590_cov23-Tisochrysis_lutea.AAC.1